MIATRIDEGAMIAARDKKRSLIPLIFFAFFAVVLSANGALIYFALSSWTGLETRNHYLKGVDYNRTLEAVRAQEKLGWTVESAVAGQGVKGHFSVSLVLRDRGGRGIDDASVKVSFERPTQYGLDQEVELTRSGAGIYSGQVALPVAGQWNLRHLVWRGAETHQTVERIFLGSESF